MRCSSIICYLSLVVSTSSQGCPDGWRSSEVVPNKCYFVAAQKKIWFDAEAFCKNAQPNAHLTSITSAFENGNVDAVVISTSSASVCDQFWIGGNDFNANDKFTWVDGNPSTYTHWASGQPDLSQQCVSSTARTTGKWKTEPCGVENCFICEMYMGGLSSTSSPPTTKPSKTTSTRTSLANSPTTKPLTTSTSPTSVVNPPTTTPASAPTNMTDCKDWLDHGVHTDGIYSINPDGRGSFNVYCDMTTDGGGWTVFQRRINGDLSFYNNSWNDYKVGFNNGLENNLWLGNDHINVLSTKDVTVELRIDIWGDLKPNSHNPNIYLWEKYPNFFFCNLDIQSLLLTWIVDEFFIILTFAPEVSGYDEFDKIDEEAHLYRLLLSSPSTGNATTDPQYGISGSNGAQFSTVDKMHDTFDNCFSEYQYGTAALNGKYVPKIFESGFSWNTGVLDINPAQSRMMLRSRAL